MLSALRYITFNIMKISLGKSLIVALTAFATNYAATAQGLQTRLVEGKVLSGGEGVENVAVTDGINIVRTDKDGNYSILTFADTRFVYITVPSGYDVAVKDSTIPQFYKELSETENYDFELTKSTTDPNHHVFFVHADAQISAEEDFEQYASVVADNVELAKNYTGIKQFAFDCGDMVGDQPWFFPGYIETIKPMNLPIYRMVGNHDMTYGGRTYETSYTTFENYFGPEHYSYDCGEAHYIVLNDNFYSGYGINYIGYVPERTFHWLEQDLAGVSKDKLVFVLFHIPSSMTTDIANTTARRSPMSNVRQFHAMFEGYNTHFISGHMHSNRNLEYNDSLYEHNVAAICGTWWRTEECQDGTPRGYAVFEVDGTDVKWYYKSSGYDRNYQMRVYGIGESEEHPNDIVANVWNYDSAWKVELLENGEKTADMEMYRGYDPISKAHCSNREIVIYDWISPRPNGHMFHATPTIEGSKRQVRVTDRFGNVYISDVK